MSKKTLLAAVVLAASLCGCRVEVFPDDAPPAPGPAPGATAGEKPTEATKEESDGGATLPPPQNDEPLVEGLYYGACLSELAFGQPAKRFNFYTRVRSKAGTGGHLELSLQALSVVNNQPPPTVSKAGAVGPELAPPAATLAANGHYLLPLGTLEIPGVANPISGGDVEIVSATLEGRFTAQKFCARLAGELVKPAAAARLLDPAKNICQFLPIEEGDAIPQVDETDFQPSSCLVP